MSAALSTSKDTRRLPGETGLVLDGGLRVVGLAASDAGPADDGADEASPTRGASVPTDVSLCSSGGGIEP